MWRIKVAHARHKENREAPKVLRNYAWHEHFYYFLDMTKHPSMIAVSKKNTAQMAHGSRLGITSGIQLLVIFFKSVKVETKIIIYIA